MPCLIDIFGCEGNRRHEPISLFFEGGCGFIVVQIKGAKLLVIVSNAKAALSATVNFGLVFNDKKLSQDLKLCPSLATNKIADAKTALS